MMAAYLLMWTCERPSLCVWSYNRGVTRLCVKGGGGGEGMCDEDGNLGKALGVKEKPLPFALRELLQKGPEKLTS